MSDLYRIEWCEHDKPNLMFYLNEGHLYGDFLSCEGSQVVLVERCVHGDIDPHEYTCKRCMPRHKEWCEGAGLGGSDA